MTIKTAVASKKSKVESFVKDHKIEISFAAGYAIGAVVSALSTGYFVKKEMARSFIEFLETNEN